LILPDVGFDLGGGKAQETKKIRASKQKTNKQKTKTKQ